MNAEVVRSIRLNGTASLGSPLRCLHLCLLGRGPENPAGSGAVLQGRERANAGLVAKTAVTMDHWNLSPKGKPQEVVQNTRLGIIPPKEQESWRVCESHKCGLAPGAGGLAHWVCL